jgi:hypothetical protein
VLWDEKISPSEMQGLRECLLKGAKFWLKQTNKDIGIEERIILKCNYLQTLRLLDWIHLACFMTSGRLLWTQ